MENKKNIWKPIFGIVIALLVIGGGYALVNKKSSTETGPIKVAFISSLMGDAGVWGQSLKKGFDFALDEINKNGGINGRQIQAMYQDDQCTATAGVSAYNQAVVIDKVKM